MPTYKIYYKDQLSKGHICTTMYCGNKTEEEIIEFFGLNNSDVEWYKVEIV